MRFSEFLNTLNEAEDKDLELDDEELDEEDCDSDKDDDEKLTEEEEFEGKITREDIIALLDDMTDDEVDEFGEFMLDILYDGEGLDEAKFFDTKQRDLDKAKRVNRAERRLRAKELAKYYRKNKSRILAKQKKYRKKAAANPNKVRHHKK